MKNIMRIYNLIKKFIFILKNYKSQISLSIKIYNDGHFCIGKKVSIEKYCIFRIKKNARLKISDKVFIGKDCEISVNNRINIGSNTSIQSRANIFGDVDILSNCIIGPNLYVSSFNHEYSKQPEELILTQDKYSRASKPVVINEDCFIGINVFIKPGIKIGRGCIIGANTNVITNLDPYTVIAGNPAKFLKNRLEFTPRCIIEYNNTVDFPYFYKGFKRNDENKICVNEKDIIIAVDINKKKLLELEIFSSFSSSIKFVNLNQKINFGQGDSNIKFDISSLNEPFLIFKVYDFSKNKKFFIKKVKSL